MHLRRTQRRWNRKIQRRPQSCWIGSRLNCRTLQHCLHQPTRQQTHQKNWKRWMNCWMNCWMNRSTDCRMNCWADYWME
jgi:hypothetical protein